MEIQNSGKLKHYIINEDLWNRSIVETEGFENEIDEIFKFDITVGQSYKLFIALNGENILDNKLFKKKNKDPNVTDGNTDSDTTKDKNEDDHKSSNGDHSGSDNDNDNHSDSDDSDEDMRDDEI